MLPHRALRALSQKRCLHTTPRQVAEDPSKPISSRKARSTRISNEISALRAGPPPPSSQPPTTSAGFVETPSTTSPGRMGQNTPAEREGIAAQGISKPDSMTEPSEGGVDVLSASAPGKADIGVEPKRDMKADGGGRAIAPTSLEKKMLLRSGEGTATIAGGNSAGVVEDRFRQVFEPGRRVAGGEMDLELKAQRLAQGLAVRVSREGLKAERRSRERDGVVVGRGTGVRGAMLDEGVKEAVVGKLVRGEFDRGGVLKREGSVVDEVRRKLALNGTYLGRDQRMLVDKVRGFLTEEQWKKVPVIGR